MDLHQSLSVRVDSRGLGALALLKIIHYSYEPIIGHVPNDLLKSPVIRKPSPHPLIEERS